MFQDGRLQACPNEFMARINAQFDERDWPAIVEQYQVNTLLRLTPSPLVAREPEEVRAKMQPGGSRPAL